MNKRISRIIALLCTLVMTIPVVAFADDENTPANYLANPGFETGIWDSGNGWNVSADSWDGGNTVATDDSHSRSGDHSAKYWFENGTTLRFSQEVALEAGDYSFGGYFDGSDAVPNISVTLGEDTLASNAVTLDGYNNWIRGNADFTLSEAATVTVHIDITISAGGWGNIDDAYLSTKIEEEEEVIDRVKIEPVTGLSQDFMCGVDVSSVIAMENAGVKYYNQEGEEEDIFKILHDSGVNTIRVRIWNDPYDADGNAYGGGNNDLETAKKIAARAAENDMKLYVDFHYSDFWAAPNKQEKPKAWRGLSTSEITAQITEFTTDSLTQLRDTGAEISIVQIGNETSGFFLGSKKWSTMAKYFKAGSKAVRNFDKNIKVMIQFGGSNNVSKYAGYCKNLKKYKVDYDIIGASWYPFYKSSGTKSNLKKNLNNIIKKYKKEIMVVENSYPTTFDDADGQGNNFSYYNYSLLKNQCDWDVSVQGQAQEIRDVIELVSNLNKGKGTGYCYWEPAWISVGDTTGLTGDAWEEQYKSNQKKWETYGCGWASSHSVGYYTTANYADTNYGGSTWENMAMFDQRGRALDSLNVFNYVYTGSEGNDEPVITSHDEPIITLNAGDELSEDGIWSSIWWDKIECTYSNGESAWTSVKWISEDGNTIVDAYKKGLLGTYTFHGVTSNFQRYMVTMKVVITGDDNYITSCDLSKTKYTYNKKSHKPTVKVVNKLGKTLKKGKHYTVKYEKDCKSIGTHKVIVKGINHYSFEQVLEYEIVPKK